MKENDKKRLIKDPIQLAILFLSAMVFFIYTGVVGLHDISHYVSAGIQMVRDNSSLTYPYDVFNPGIKQSVYDYYQRNSKFIDLRTEYPSPGYSILFGIGYLITGKVLFVIAHIVTFALFCLSNILLYRALRNLIHSQIASLIGIAMIPFYVLSRSVIYPSNGVFEYFAISVLLWGLYAAKLDLNNLSIILGFLSVFRPQILFLVPCLFFFESSKLLLREKILRLLPYVVVSSAIYRFVDLLVKWMFTDVDDVKKGNFYLIWLKTLLLQTDSLKNALTLMFENTVNNLLLLFTPGALFFLALLPLLLMRNSIPNTARRLILAGITAAAPPLVIYSLDPKIPVQARYFTATLIFFNFAGLIIGMSYKKIPERIRIGSFGVIFAIIFSLYFSNFGLPLSNALSPSVMKSRLLFLQLSNFPTILNDNFSARDVMLVNHSYFTALKRFENVLPAPSYSEFYSGDNRGIGGLLLVSASDPINGFFNREDFKIAGEYPPMIIDGNGVRFNLVGKDSTCVDEAKVACIGRIDFYAYKNQLSHSYAPDELIGYDQNLSKPLIKSPKFEDLQDWGQSGNTTIDGWNVGPGNESSNILRQVFAVNPESNLLVTWMSKSGSTKSSIGRFQIIWLTKASEFISSEDSKYYLGPTVQRYSYKARVPENAFFGVLYGIPYGNSDLVTFFEMNAFEILR